MSELGLIQRIRNTIGEPGPGTRIGLGDDGAVLEPSSGLTILTCDAFVEDVHFRRAYATLDDIGFKCIVANQSDVAAMGGFPAQAVISLCVPADMSESDVLSLYGGMLEAESRFGGEIVGGDVVASTSGLIVSVAMLGVVGPTRVVTRRGAVPGDAIVVTGEIGGSDAGLLALSEGLPREGRVADAVRRHLRPTPRMAEAQAILDVGTPHAMIDVSDGLGTDLNHLADESGVGVVVRESCLPVASASVAVAEALDRDPYELAMGSGEEFEIVVALPVSEVERSVEHVEAVTGTRLTMIGEIVEATAGRTLVSRDGCRRPLARTGYEHAVRG